MLTPDRVRPLSSWLFGTAVAAVLLTAGLAVAVGSKAPVEPSHVTPRHSKALEESLERLEQSKRQLEELTANAREITRTSRCNCG